MMPYLGYRSWNAWNVSLWLYNEDSLYHMMCATVRRYGKGGGARMLKHLLPDKTPDGAPYTLTSIRDALRRLDLTPVSGRRAPLSAVRTECDKLAQRS